MVLKARYSGTAQRREIHSFQLRLSSGTAANFPFVSLDAQMGRYPYPTSD